MLGIFSSHAKIMSIIFFKKCDRYQKINLNFI
nr:MAG TPA: hypothetical protein [Caudoviricetes sp.]